MLHVGDKVADNMALRKGIIIFISLFGNVYVQWENKSVSIMKEHEICPANAIPKDENSEL